MYNAVQFHTFRDIFFFKEKTSTENSYAVKQVRILTVRYAMDAEFCVLCTSALHIYALCTFLYRYQREMRKQMPS
jgi:hypothetical protein